METQPYRVENGVLMTVVLGPTDDGADDRGAVAILRGVVGRVDGGVRVQGVSAKVTPRSMPLARIRPVPLACARRNEGLPDP